MISPSTKISINYQIKTKYKLIKLNLKDH